MSFFREPFKTHVTEQLDLRASLLQEGRGKKRSSQFFQHYVNKTAFIRIASTVEILEEGIDLSRNFMLEGAPVDENGRKIPQGKFNGKGLLNNPKYRTNADDDGFGIVPPPGILDFSISTKTFYGSLRESTIVLRTFSLNQFNVIEKLYGRPGHHVLVEWGWSNYIDPENKESHPIGSLVSDSEAFWGKDDIDPNEIHKIIDENKKLYSACYDGFLGIIKNFNSNSHPDGGYTIKIQIISRGDIIDSLKLDKASNTINISENLLDTINQLKQPNTFIELGDDGDLQTINLNKDEEEEDHSGDNDLEETRILSYSNLRAFIKETIRYGLLSIVNNEDIDKASLFQFSIDEEKQERLFPLDNIDIIQTADNRLVGGLALEEFEDEVLNTVAESTNVISAIADLISGNAPSIINFNENLENLLDQAFDPEVGVGPYIRLGYLIKYLNEECVPRDAHGKPIVTICNVSFNNDFNPLSKDIKNLENVYPNCYNRHSMGTAEENSIYGIILDNVRIADEIIGGNQGNAYKEGIALKIHKAFKKYNSTIDIFFKTYEELNNNEIPEESDGQKMSLTREQIIQHTFGFFGPGSATPQKIIFPHSLFGSIQGTNHTISTILNGGGDGWIKSSTYVNLPYRDLIQQISPIDNIIEGSPPESFIFLKNQLDQINDTLFLQNKISTTSFSQTEHLKNQPGILAKNPQCDPRRVIDNLYINLFWLDDLLKEKKDITLDNLLDEICTSVNDASGGYYNLKAITNPLFADMISIVDLNISSNQLLEKKTKMYSFPPIGYGSIYKNLSVDGTIPNAMATTIAIAAQNPRDSRSIESISYRAFLGDIRDRVSSPTVSLEQDEEENKKEVERREEEIIDFLATIVNFVNSCATFLQFKIDNFRDVGHVDKEWFREGQENSVEALKNIINNMGIIATNEIHLVDGSPVLRYGQNPLPISSIIPLKIKMTLEGISGITTSNIFKISKGVLPSQYNKENVSFLITKESQNIRGMNWETDIEGSIILDDNGEYGQYVPRTETPIPRRAKNPTPPTSTKTRGDAQSYESVLNKEEEEGQNATKLRSVINSLGYNEKGNEIDNGGDISEEIAKVGSAFLKWVKKKVPQASITLTSGNDEYHQGLPYTSRHSKGNALDFVINGPYQRYLPKIVEISDQFIAGNNQLFRYIDEYSKPTSHATAGHIHMSYGLGTEAQSVVNNANELAKLGRIKPIKIDFNQSIEEVEGIEI